MTDYLKTNTAHKMFPSEYTVATNLPATIFDVLNAELYTTAFWPLYKVTVQNNLDNRFNLGKRI
jgi:hypothetical protein